MENIKKNLLLVCILRQINLVKYPSYVFKIGYSTILHVCLVFPVVSFLHIFQQKSHK
jgi:hypothetical protein